MIEAALDFARRGFRVLPVRPNSKKPFGEGWQKRATSDPDAIRKWWAEAEEACGDKLNIGLAMGQGMIALDLDKKGDKDGFKSLSTIVPAGAKIPASWSTITPHAGLHRFLRVPSDLVIKNSNSSLAPGVDIKADGGFVVAPGSTFGGKQYAWKPGYSPDDIPLSDAPQYLLDLLHAKKSKPRKAVLPSIDLDRDESIDWARRWLIDEAPEAVEGSAGREVTKQVIQRVFDFGLSPAGAYELLTEDGGWDELKSKPFWLATEAEALESLCYGLWEKRENPPGYLSPLNSGFDAVELPANELKSFELTKKLSKFTFRAFDEMADAALAEPSNFLVEGLLDCGCFSAMFGAPGAGKSFVALELAYCIATGEPVAGREVRQGLVVYMALEGAGGVKRRAAALRKFKKSNPNPPLIFCDNQFNLYASRADAKGLCESLKEPTETSGLPLRLIIIDTLALAIAGGDENTAKDMGALIANAKEIARVTGAHVMVIHHSGKDVSKEERGSSSLRAAADTMIQLVVCKKIDHAGASVKQGVMNVLKQKDGEEGSFVGYRLRRQPVGATADMKVIDSCVVEFLPAMDVAALEKPASRVQLDVLEAFEVAEEEVGPGEWVALDKLYEAAKAAADEEGGKARSKEAVRKAADRLAETKQLIKDGQNWRRLVKQ
ncbi:MAG TPA: AAA family ATPase [Aestuariivirga sp.]|nr:AAA family ATPase [Aestuariivirga sp.]